MTTATARGSASPTGLDDTQEFVRGLELTARSILKKANKRRKEELRRQQIIITRKSGCANVTAPHKFIVEIPPGVREWGNQLGFKTMEIASTGMTAAVRPTAGEHPNQQSLDGMDTVCADRRSAPGGSGSAIGHFPGDSGRTTLAGRKLPKITRRVGRLTFGAPPRMHPSGVGVTSQGVVDGSGGGVGSAGEVKTGKNYRAPVPPAKIDDRLIDSPFFSESMVELTKPPQWLPATPGAGQDGRAPEGLSSTRATMTGSKVRGVIGRGTTVGLSSTVRNPKSRGVHLEVQGVMSWSADDLRVKYRAEREREEAYQASRLEEQVAEALEQNYGQAVAVPEIDRHPLYAEFFAQLERENSRCLLHASTQNKMKRFLTDVNTAWLTNLAHRPEIRRIGADPAVVPVGNHLAGGVDGAVSSDAKTASVMDRSELEAGGRRRGLDGGRDTVAITASQSQTQSVSPELAFRRAVRNHPAGGVDGAVSSDAKTASVMGRSESEAGGRRGLDGGRDTVAITASQSQIQPVCREPAFRRTVCDHPAGGVDGAVSSDAKTAAVMNRSESEADGRRRGLDEGRDTVAITASQSQIQSVCPEPAFRRAVLYSSSSKPSPREEDRQGSDLKCERSLSAPVTFSSNARPHGNHDGNDEQWEESPELAPPIPKPPTLTVLVGERRRLVAHPQRSEYRNSGDGGHQETSGGDEGGVEEMSTSGDGTAVDSVLLSEMRTRMLRVLRFEPPPAVAVEDTTRRSSSIVSNDDQGQSSHDRCSNGVSSPSGATDQKPSETATWIVSSYFPYDGSEAHVFIRDAAVEDAVGKALSSTRCRFPAATGSDGKTKGRVGIGTGDSLPMLLRRGARIPVLDHDGRIAKIVLTVLEVFVVSSSRGVSSGNQTAPENAAVDDENDDNWSAPGNTRLKIVAYPVTAGCPPHGRRRCPQRVILTVESLWHRRQHLNPDVGTLRGNPPSNLVDSSTETRDRPLDLCTRSEGKERGMNIRVEDGDEVSGGVGAKGGDRSCGNGMFRGLVVATPEAAIEDIVRVVAFGPQDDLDVDDHQDGSRVMPLLLRPPQSVGSEVLTVPRAPERGFGAWTVGVPGVDAATLAAESRAEVLLSLVRLRACGSRGPPITLDGVPNSVLEEGQQERVRTWEENADRIEPLSIRVCGRRYHTREVPGTSTVGKAGVTFTYPQAEERTQPVGSFFRDASVSSSNSVMVVVTLALDTPRLNSLVTAWERELAEPGTAPDEDILCDVPRVMIGPQAVQREIASGIETRTAPRVLILTSADSGEDTYPAMATDGTIGGMAWKAVDAAPDQQEEGLKHRREFLQVDEQGFRRYCIYRLSEPDGHLHTLAFGVTKRAVLPNVPGVCGRNTFHSEQRCTEQLCQQRTAKDYASVSANFRHRGFSDPGIYTVSCKHERMKALMRTGLERYNIEMARIARQQEFQAKVAALQAKLEIEKVQLAKRRAMEDAVARSLAGKADARYLKSSAFASRSRRKWELRLQDSRVLETRGEWEQRRDSGGSVFYYCASKKALPEPFSWDPPDCWREAIVIPPGKTASSGEEKSAPRGVGDEDAIGDLSSFRAIGVAQGPDAAAPPNATSPTALVVARTYTDEEKVSLAVTRLAENEKLLEALAWRLGIPLVNVRRDGREPPLTRNVGGQGSVDGGTEYGEGGGGDHNEDEEEIDENREQIELGDFDEMSDGDGEHGDANEPPGPLPQDHSDLRRTRIAERRRRNKELEGFGYKQPRQVSVPSLSLGEVRQHAQGGANALPPQGLPASDTLEAEVGGKGWRRLARVTLGDTFLEKLTSLRTEGPRPEAVNTRPKPRQTGTVDPTTASRPSEDFSVPVTMKFISDLLKEHARVLHETKHWLHLDGMDKDDASGPLDAAELSTSRPQGVSITERHSMALAEIDGRRSKEESKAEKAKDKAVIAAKIGNLEDLEGLLYDHVPIDTRDSNGNTLLILAVQQGDKRIAKFLLRKGAAMNLQNKDGNTVLHFCHSLGRQDLAEYLMSKGADDSLLNSEGLTCYEGLRAHQLEEV